MKKFIILSLLFVAPFSHSSDWLHLFSSDTDSYSADLESFNLVDEYNKDVIKAWIKIEVIKDLKKDGLGVGDYSLVLYHFDCKAKKLGMSNGVRYKNGNLIEPSFNAAFPKMNYAVPDSIGDVLLSRSCSIFEIQNGTRSYMQIE